MVALWQDMSTQAVVAERKLTKYFREPKHRLHETLNIAMRITIQSDASRIFQALTQPEFLETWIAIPGDAADSHMVAWQNSSGFRFDHYRNGKRDLMIDGEYRVLRRRKLLFTWRVTGDNSAEESLVYIGLHGNFNETLLELHHRGIASPAEHNWQHEMWRESLGRLVRLLGC
jgi:uncharacterized protein YndB with AHSA1/START domain